MDEESVSVCNCYETVSCSKSENEPVSAGHAIDRLVEHVTESAFNNAFRELKKLDDNRPNLPKSKSNEVVALEVNTNNALEEIKQLPTVNEKTENKNTDLTLKLTEVAEDIKESKRTVNFTSLETEINTLAQTIVEACINNALQQIKTELEERVDESSVQDIKQQNQKHLSGHEERYIDTLVLDIVEHSIENAVRELEKEQTDFSDVEGAHSDIIVDVRNLRNELVDLEDDILNGDFGLVELFKENLNAGSRRKGQPKPTVKSKSARKRKKQLQKLSKHVGGVSSGSSKFATTFTELQVEKDVDPNLSCAVCLEMFYLPNECRPCGHIFCEPCLRRLTGQGSERVLCPLCRAVIMYCVLNADFSHFIRLTHPDIHIARSVSERRSKFRHYALPYTPPVPLGRRLLRNKILFTNRNNQPNTRWVSHYWFRYLLVCTVGVFFLLIKLLNKVGSRDVNIMFLCCLVGALVTYILFTVELRPLELDGIGQNSLSQQ